MAATYRASFAGGATSGTGDRAITFTPAVGDLLVVFVALSGNTNATPTCSDNQGGTYTRILRAAWNASADNSACFVRDQLVASAVSHVATVASGSNTAGEIVVVAVAGMTRTGSSAVRSSGSQANQAASSTPAPALSQSALTGNMTLCAVASGDTTTSPNASWTERQDVSQATPTTALEVGTRDSGFTGTTITFGATQSTVYASLAIELDGSVAPVNVDPNRISATSSIPQPTLVDAVDPARISATTAIPQPTTAVTVDAPLRASTSTVASPTLICIASPGAIAATTTVFAPLVESGGTVDVPRIAATTAVAAPTFAVALDVGALGPAANVRAPTLDERLDAVTVTATTSIPTPTLDVSLGAATIATGSTVPQPVIGLIVSAQAITPTSTMHAPTFDPTLIAAALGPGVHVWYPQIGDQPMHAANRARPRAHRARGR